MAAPRIIEAFIGHPDASLTITHAPAFGIRADDPSTHVHAARIPLEEMDLPENAPVFRMGGPA